MTIRIAAIATLFVLVGGCAIAQPVTTPLPSGPDVSAGPTGNQLTTAQRDALRLRAELLYQAVTADPNNFAGIYSTDEGGRWRIVVRYVGDAPSPDVLALVAADIPVDWIQAKYSMAQLNAVANELLSGLQSEFKAKRVSQITPDEATNTVLVGFPQEEPDLRQALAGRYGDIVSFKMVPVFEPIQ